MLRLYGKYLADVQYMGMWAKLAIACVLASALCSSAQTAPKQDQQNQNQSSGPQANQAPPRSQPNTAPRGPGDSSSRETNPVAGPEVPDDSVTEFHSWDPHKAQKDVEIGDFYLSARTIVRRSAATARRYSTSPVTPSPHSGSQKPWRNPTIWPAHEPTTRRI